MVCDATSRRELAIPRPLARKWWLQCDRSWGPLAFVEGGEYSCCYGRRLSENAAVLRTKAVERNTCGRCSATCWRIWQAVMSTAERPSNTDRDRTIRESARRGVTMRELADRHGVTTTRIRQIIYGR